MPEQSASPKRDAAVIALLAVGGTCLLAAGRYLSARKVSAAERLAEALLETDRLRDADHKLPDKTEAVLADCAAYLINVAYRAAEGVGAASGPEDPIGYSRTHTHPYTRDAATVLTEANAPEHILTYAVALQDVGEVRGTRRVGPLRMSGLSPARPTPDTVQINLKDGYTAQLETELETGDYLVTGRTKLFGAATLRDNRGNVGRLNIGFDGNVSGTVTRDARVIGRFEGKVGQNVQFKQYQIESGG